MSHALTKLWGVSVRGPRNKNKGEQISDLVSYFSLLSFDLSS